MNDNKRNHTIDLLKGVLILIVCFVHFDWAKRDFFFVFSLFRNMVIPAFMIVSGYVCSLSFKKRNILAISEAYKFEYLFPKIIRYAVPYFIFVVWMIIDPNVTKVYNGFFDVIKWFLNGTHGKGGYFFPVMNQFLFIFPVVYFIIEHKKKQGIVFCLIINMIYEILVWSYGVPTDSYRFIVFRYVFVIAVGVYAFKEYKLNKLTGILMSLAGLVFIAMIDYAGYNTVILDSTWSDRSFIASMSIVPLMIWILQNVNVRLLLLEIAGRASYNIYLFQMAYYLGYDKYVNTLNGITWMGHMVIGVLISVTGGIIFYYIETPLTKKITLIILDKTNSRKIGAHGFTPDK